MSTPTVPFYPMTHDDAQELISAVRTKDTSNLADVYDPTTTYDVGEFCVHNNMLYKCTTAISSPEAWTAAHWSSEKVCDNLQDTEQTDKIKSDIGIVEDGNAATHAISAGQYVIWKDELYMADDAISIGETLASSGGSKNLTAKPNGLGGEVAALNSNMTQYLLTNNHTIHPASISVPVGSSYTAPVDGIYFLGGTIANAGAAQWYLDSNRTMILFNSNLSTELRTPIYLKQGATVYTREVYGTHTIYGYIEL